MSERPGIRFGADVLDGGAATRFRIWAPRPRSIELEVDGRRLAFERDLLGFGDVTVPGVGHGARYCYVLDGERRRPDPASRSQPDGVHAASQVIDPRRFRWSDAGYRQPPLTALYELHVGTFSPSGNFDGVLGRLEDVRGAGFDTVELMPVASWPGPRGWGYDGVCWLAPQASYGGPDKLRALVDGAHAKGVAVVLDVVFNHLGPEGNYLGDFGPYFTEHATGWGSALDLDGPAAGPVRAFILHCARSLVDEYHLDGVRLDAVHAFVDRSPQHLVAELAAALHASGVERGRPVWVIAESDLGLPSVVETPAEGGWGCDALWHDDLHHALHAALTGERHAYYADYATPHAQVARTLERGFLHTGRRSGFRARSFGAPGAHLDGGRIVACAQNHDQVGNRAEGDRLTTIVPGAEHASAMCICTSPFLPLVFMGEEHAETAPFPYFTSFDDAALVKAVRDGRRREFGDGAPDPNALDTFVRARVDPQRTGARGQALRRYYRALLELRRARPSLACGPLARTEAVAEGDAIVVRRTSALDESLAVYRLGKEGGQRAIELPRARHGQWRVLVDAGEFSGPRGARLDGDRVTLPPHGAILLGAP